MDCCLIQQVAAVNGHASGVFALMITLRIHKPQGPDAEVGAESGHTPNVEWTGRLNQNDHPWRMRS